MSKSTFGLRRAGIASLATTALVIGAGFAGMGAAQADEDFAFERVDGRDRYVVSAKTAEKFGTAGSVLLASGEEGKFGDALTASYLAGDRQVPVLLTELDSTPEVITDAIDSLGTNNITVVGGPLSVSEANVDALEADGYTVNRVFGQTRYDTAAAVIREAGARGNDTAVVATGEKFPDALSAGPLAYAEAMPIGTVSLTDAPDVVINALKDVGVNKAVVLGGNLSVGSEPREELEDKGITIVEEFQGRTRGAVSQQVAEYGQTLGISDTRVNVASGRAFSEGADALGGGTLSGEQNRPILITDGEDVVGPFVLDYLNDNCETLTATDNLLFGGLLSIGQPEEDAMEAAARCENQPPPTSNQDFTASPAGDQSAEAGTVLQYSFSGLTPGSRVDIQLVDCSNVATDANGVTTFSGTNPGGANNVAQNDNAPSATVNVVNGVANGGTDEVLVPTSGTVSFSINTTGAAGECFVAVVFNDADDDDRIDLNPNGQPSEAFGNSGDINVLFAEAGEGGFTTTVQALNKADNWFQGGNSTYFYDANDEFLLEAGATDTALTMEQFEARISAGDSVSGNYRTNPANQSTFTLTDTAPVAPTSVTTRAPQGDNAGKGGLEVVFNDSTTASTASYNVLRATATQPSVIGGAVTCPDAQTTAGAGAYSVIGTVSDVTPAPAGGYVFYDGTAQAPASGQTAPQYCYTVQAVDQTGDAGPLADETDPATASPVSTAQGMSFQSNADTRVVNANTINVDYNNVVNGGTVAANGSDFIVTATTTGANPVSEDITVLSATKNGADAEGDLVTIITSEAIPAGQTVTVTSKTGTDTNTVCAGTATTNCQPVGQVVQLSDGDVVGPTATDADTNVGDGLVFGNGAEDTIGIDFDEAPVVQAGDEFVVDANGAAAGGTTTLTVVAAGDNDAAGEVAASVVGTTLTLTANANTGTITMDHGTSTITSSDVTDADGNAADGFPQVIDAD